MDRQTDVLTVTGARKQFGGVTALDGATLSLREGELLALLDALAAQGREVEDVDVRGPSLQAVFIHLTGRELRE